MDRNHALLPPASRARAPLFRTGGRAQACLGCARAVHRIGLIHKKSESNGGVTAMIKLLISDREKDIAEMETVETVEEDSA